MSDSSLLSVNFANKRCNKELDKNAIWEYNEKENCFVN